MTLRMTTMTTRKNSRLGKPELQRAGMSKTTNKNTKKRVVQVVVVEREVAMKLPIPRPEALRVVLFVEESL